MHLERRGYLPSATRDATEKANAVHRQDALKLITKQDKDMVPLVITYHPHLPPLQKILRCQNIILTLSRPGFFYAPVASGHIVPPFEYHVTLVLTAYY